jgi:hypothetical protein
VQRREQRGVEIGAGAQHAAAERRALGAGKQRHHEPDTAGAGAVRRGRGFGDDVETQLARLVVHRGGEVGVPGQRREHVAGGIGQGQRRGRQRGRRGDSGDVQGRR